MSNVLCEWIARRLGTEHVLRVRYEDLVTDAPGQLRRVGEFAGLDLDDLIGRVESGRALTTGHEVAGNRLRFQEEVRIRPDLSWTSEMPALYRWGLATELWPLLLRYGYLGP